MATMKLFRCTLTFSNSSMKVMRQTQTITSKSCRLISSAVSKNVLYKDRHHTMRALEPVSMTRRVMSTNAEFEVINVQDEADFQKKVINASSCTPVIVDFHATWCGPCKLLAPRLESIVGQKAGKVILAKVDIDDNTELAMEYGVRSVPMVMGIKNGKTMSQFLGAIDDDQIDDFVEKLIIS